MNEDYEHSAFDDEEDLSTMVPVENTAPTK